MNPTKPALSTTILHSEAKPPQGFSSLTTPTHRASTTTYSSVQEFFSRGYDLSDPYAYGLYGTPTVHELQARIAEIEGAARTLLVPSGLSAITTLNLALLRAGDHVLVPDSAYGPGRAFSEQWFSRFGIECTVYDPMLPSLASHYRPRTRLVWLESPGSMTFEVQDVPALAAEARAKGVLTAIDHTWSAGVWFKPFQHGCDYAVQALTKYFAGHSDLVLGSISACSPETFAPVLEAHRMLGLGVSPDDAQLVLRGLQTLVVRLKHYEASALRLARLCAEQPEIERVLHPALPSCPGHERFKRDFTGSSGVFSIVFQEGVSEAQVHGFVESLRLFRIGFSWGGTHALVIPCALKVSRLKAPYDNRVVRLNVGLEAPEDLETDVRGAFEALRRRANPSK